MILYVGKQDINVRHLTLSNADNIVSIGDQVLNGVYARLSTFRRAVNFSDRHRVITVVPDTMEPGPACIVMRGFDSESLGAVVRIDNEILQIGPVPYALNGIPIYDSTLDLCADMPSSFPSQLALLRRMVVDQASPKSLAFLFNPHAAQPTKPSFERLYAERMIAGHRLLRECLPHGRPIRQLREAIGLMAGAGIGLTPSGNDFIAGMLLALHVYDRLAGLDHSFVRHTIYHAAHSSHLLTMHFLEMAFQGFFHAPLKDVAHALCGNDRETLESAARRALAMGETSGADLLAGFITTLEICMGAGS